MSSACVMWFSRDSNLQITLFLFTGLPIKNASLPLGPNGASVAVIFVAIGTVASQFIIERDKKLKNIQRCPLKEPRT